MKISNSTRAYNSPLKTFWYVCTFNPGYQKIHQPYPPLFNLLTKQWKLIHFYTFQLWDQMVRQCHRYKDGTSE